MKYNRINWKDDDPSTPISWNNLRRIDNAIVTMHGELDDLDSTYPESFSNSKRGFKQLKDTFEVVQSKFFAAPRFYSRYDKTYKDVYDWPTVCQKIAKLQTKVYAKM